MPKRSKTRNGSVLHAKFETISDSDSSSEDIYTVCNFHTPVKKRYKRSIHHGLNKKRAFHHKVSPEKQPACCNEGQDQRQHVTCHQTIAQGTCTDSMLSLSSTSTDTETDFLASSDNEELNVDTVALSSDLSDTSEDCGDELDSISCSSSDITSDNHKEDSDTSISTHDKLLYDGCKLTPLDSSMLVMLFVTKHSLSKEAFSDLLQLISAHLPPKTGFTTSPYRMKETLKTHSGYNEPIIHRYCEECEKYLGPGQTCDNAICCRNKAQVLQSHDLRIVDQLKNLFQDGVTLFSSSKKGNLWPVYIAINELPIKLRFSRKYMLPCYLHCQVEKPNMTTYLSPMMRVLDDLFDRGFEVLTTRGRLKVQAQLIAVSLDLPARALVANMKQFNGKSSCSICLDEGETPQGNPLHRYFPYRQDSVMRTHHSMVDDARQAIEQNSAVHGIKGVSPLIMLNYVDLPKIFVIDWMHCVLLGVTKALMSFWFNGQNKNRLFYVGDKITLLNKRLGAIKTPDFVSRRPRKLEEHGHWKATECREWLIHFSAPVLHGIMDPTPPVHYLLLVTAMSILTRDGIQVAEVERAEQLLDDFCKLYADIYGERAQTMNVHMLKHLAPFTRLYGPLFTVSCCGFESMNSYLKGMFHGTRYINKQVGFAVAMTKHLSGMVRTLISSSGTDERTRQLAISLSSKFMKEDKFQGEVTVSVLGKKKMLHPSDEVYHLLSEEMKASGPVSFMRFQKSDMKLHCKRYQLAKTRNNFTVCFGSNGDKFGDILTFLEVKDQYFAVIDEYKTSSYAPTSGLADSIANVILRHYIITGDLCPHMFKVDQNAPTKSLVHVDVIGKKCVLMHVTDGLTVISCPQNLMEHGEFICTG